MQTVCPPPKKIIFIIRDTQSSDDIDLWFRKNRKENKQKCDKNYERENSTKKKKEKEKKRQCPDLAA